MCSLTIRLVDERTGEPLPGIVAVTRENGESLGLSELLERGAKRSADGIAKRWHVLVSPRAIEVPREKLTIEAFSGIETYVAQETIDLRSLATAEIRLSLRRFYDAAGRGLKSGNTHLHLAGLTRKEADRYLSEVPRADATDLTFVSYLERFEADARYITNQYTLDDLKRLEAPGHMFGYGEEHRHNFGEGGEGYGHVMLLDIKRLILPVSIGPGIMHAGTDGITLRRGIDTAHNDDATVIWCHNKFGLEDVPNWVAGVLDAQNIWDGAPHLHGSYELSYYKYLNIGIRVPFSTGTDWFIYDFSRAYTPVEGELTVQKWLRSLSAGKAFITNGTLLDFDVEGKGSGDVISLAGPQSVKVTGRAVGRNDFDQLEVIQNGKVVGTAQAVDAGGHFESRLNTELRLDGPAWIALRIPGTGKNELDHPLFAHTSPVYVDMNGRGVFDPDVARDLIRDMEQAMVTIQEQGVFDSEAEKDSVLSVYRTGIDILQRRLDQQ
jgi:hypothetical protein